MDDEKKQRGTTQPAGPPEQGPARAPASRRSDDPPDLRRGTAIIQEKMKTLPDRPGVYRMIDAAGDVLYVGKARSLKKRVPNYTHALRLPARLQRMVAETRAMEFVTTHTEVEALLLESNLIKTLKPRFNVLLRDDKSFPHILLEGDHDFPRAVKHRGARRRKGDYFGPFASAGAVNRTLVALQRAFLLRNCSNADFETRTRPCLQYQIRRCSAPCVGHASKEEYAAQVGMARKFLAGESRDIQKTMADAMQAASEALDFEAAAKYRDRIRALSAIQADQGINVEGIGDADVIALYMDQGQAAVQVFFFRGGSNQGGHAFFPAHDKAQAEAEILSGFITQFYENRDAPKQVLASHDVPEAELIGEALGVRAGRKVTLSRPQRGDRKRLMDHALDNARDAHARRQAERSTQARLLEGLAEKLGLDSAPDRVEVYDNSHISGTNMIGAMIVAGPQGLMKNAWRKFNVKGDVKGGDDYAMMAHVIERRFARALKEDPERTGENWPDLVLIDGGRGQLNAVLEVVDRLGITDIAFVGIAKGLDRNAGRERFFMRGREEFTLAPDDPVMYFLQRLRDQAHRFAIGTHRAKREKAIAGSPLDDIAGIGPARKKALLMHFGSARSVARAGLSDLESVEGISKQVAQKIYDHFHERG